MRPAQLIEQKLSHSIIGAFYEVYNTLGFGFLEQVYVLSLQRELEEQGHHVAREVCVQVSYKGFPVGLQRIDMIVDNKVVVETKSTYELHRAAQRQILNYLRATKLEVGLLLHFGPEAKFFRMVSTGKSAKSAEPAESASNLPLRSQPEAVTVSELDQSPTPAPDTPDSTAPPGREA